MTSLRPRTIAAVVAGVLAVSVVHEARAGLAEAVQAFDEGNGHYTVGNYDAAVQAYVRALQEGYVSAALFYNMGNAYYRQDELGEAVRAYERARLLAPADPEILHNLSIVEERTVDQFSRVPAPYWERAWHAVVRETGAWSLFAIGILCWFAAAAVLMRRTLTGSNSPWLRRTLTVTLTLGSVLLTSAFAASLDEEHSRRAVVVANELPLRSEASRSADPEVTVHEGLIVDLLHEQDSWTLLRLPNGARGWAPADAIAEIAYDER